MNRYYNDYKNAYGILYSTDKVCDTNSFIGFMNDSVYITKSDNGVTYTGITSEEAIQYLVADAYARKIASKLGIIGNNISDEEKIYRICRWYIDNGISYDYTYSNYKAYNAFVDKTCICQGYAESFYLLCQYADIKCEYNDMPQICHIDNYIYINNKKYEIDITNTDNWINGEVMSVYGITEENVYRITPSGFV